MDKYSISVGWSEEDQEWVATAPQFPGLSALAKTRAKALAEFDDVLALAIETLNEAGESLPAPLRRDNYSGSLRLRMPKSLHRRLAEKADREGVSLNTALVAALAESMADNGEVDVYTAGDVRLIRRAARPGKMPPVGFSAFDYGSRRVQ
jgi:predicted RNase H-like HicB family nuclease